MRKKKIFWVYSCFSLLLYIKGGVFIHNWKAIMTKYWNHNDFVQILYSDLRYTDRPLDVFFLLLAVILSELHENSRRKD